MTDAALAARCLLSQQRFHDAIGTLEDIRAALCLIDIKADETILELYVGATLKATVTKGTNVCPLLCSNDNKYVPK
jgi:hypothetical protein